MAPRFSREHHKKKQKEQEKQKLQTQSQPTKTPACVGCGKHGVNHTVATDAAGTRHCMFTARIQQQCPFGHVIYHCQTCMPVNHCAEFCKPAPRPDFTKDHYVQTHTETESPWRPRELPQSASGRTPMNEVGLMAFVKPSKK